jgi:stringent starvation protein B
MQEYEINVSNIEELQMTNDVIELEQIFYRAKSVVVQGEVVSLVRENSDGTTYKFEEITTEADLDNYKQTVFKYL